MQVTCPATITRSTTLDSGGLDINPATSGNGCVVLLDITGP
jgi:hypothetical protein